MKKITPYLYVVLPLILISLYQNIYLPKGDVAGSKSLNTIAHQPEVIVYQLQTTITQKLTSDRLNDELETIVSINDATSFLERYLSLAKTYSSSSYIGFALSGFENLEQKLKINPNVQLKYADILEYSHDFSNALLVLKEVGTQRIYSAIATLRRLNIYMIQGDLNNVELECDNTKNGEYLSIYPLCHLWLEGIKGNARESINKLQHLSSFMQIEQKFMNWYYQLLLDLYLKDGDVEGAGFLLSIIFTNISEDKSSLIQIIDYLIMNQDKKLAQKLIEQYDVDHDLVIRRVLVNNNDSIASNLYRRAEDKIQLLKSIQDSSKYREIALWSLIIDHDPFAAKKYAVLNYENYKTLNDQLLLNFTAINYEMAGSR